MNILIVEDDALTRMRLRRLLENEGHHVTECDNGAAALEEFISRPEPPEIVITDWMMPEMDGLNLARNIRNITQGKSYTYIILLTSRGDPQDLLNGFKDGGVDDYVVKPFSVDELKVRVQVGDRVVRLERRQRDYSASLELIVRRQTQTIRATQDEIVGRLLAALEFRDEETGDHVHRIGLTSALMAQTLGWEPDQVDEMRTAAAMHDIGKVGVPDAILQKPGKLTPEEFKIIQTHTVIGGHILKASTCSLIQMGREVALNHHEKWDGSGYPSGQRGEDIPLVARIVAIVDVFDALCNDRVYRPALEQEQVLSIMREGRGSHFDPKLFDLFMSLLPEAYKIQSEFNQ